MKDIEDFVSLVFKDRSTMTIGLGSGSAAQIVVEEMGRQARLKGVSVSGVPSSAQIAIAAASAGFTILNPIILGHLDLVIDGADQLAEDGAMIKGGGGALARERILWEASDGIHVFIRKERTVKSLSLPLPVEFLPFSLSVLKRMIEDRGMHATLRANDKGYPFVSENGNFIFDVAYEDVKKAYGALRNLPGVLDVGLFMYKAKVHLI